MIEQGCNKTILLLDLADPEDKYPIYEELKGYRRETLD
jgi:hypothetical protein